MKTLRLIGFGLLAVLLSFAFASCDPDDDGDEEVGNNLIVGWWQDGEIVEYYMKKDGTYAYYNEGKLRESMSGTWSYDEKAKVWSQHRNDGHSYTYIIHILNENTFSFTDLKYGDTETWRRIKR